MLRTQVIPKIQDYFSQKPQVVAVYLYGSRARGEAKKTSDVDLGVILKKKAASSLTLPQLVFTQKLSQLLKKEVEVQDLASCRLDFVHRVLSEGQLIFSSDEAARIKFETEVFKKYFDLKPLFDEYYRSLAEITKKGELHVRYL